MEPSSNFDDELQQMLEQNSDVGDAELAAMISNLVHEQVENVQREVPAVQSRRRVPKKSKKKRTPPKDISKITLEEMLSTYKPSDINKPHNAEDLYDEAISAIIDAVGNIKSTSTIYEIIQCCQVTAEIMVNSFITIDDLTDLVVEEMQVFLRIYMNQIVADNFDKYITVISQNVQCHATKLLLQMFMLRRLIGLFIPDTIRNNMIMHAVMYAKAMKIDEGALVANYQFTGNDLKFIDAVTEEIICCILFFKANYDAQHALDVEHGIDDASSSLVLPSTTEIANLLAKPDENGNLEIKIKIDNLVHAPDLVKVLRDVFGSLCNSKWWLAQTQYNAEVNNFINELNADELVILTPLMKLSEYNSFEKIFSKLSNDQLLTLVENSKIALLDVLYYIISKHINGNIENESVILLLDKIASKRIDKHCSCCASKDGHSTTLMHQVADIVIDIKDERILSSLLMILDKKSASIYLLRKIIFERLVSLNVEAAVVSIENCNVFNKRIQTYIRRLLSEHKQRINKIFLMKSVLYEADLIYDTIMDNCTDIECEKLIESNVFEEDDDDSKCKTNIYNGCIAVKDISELMAYSEKFASYWDWSSAISSIQQYISNYGISDKIFYDFSRNRNVGRFAEIFQGIILHMKKNNIPLDFTKVKLHDIPQFAWMMGILSCKLPFWLLTNGIRYVGTSHLTLHDNISPTLKLVLMHFGVKYSNPYPYRHKTITIPSGTKDPLTWILENACTEKTCNMLLGAGSFLGSSGNGPTRELYELISDSAKIELFDVDPVSGKLLPKLYLSPKQLRSIGSLIYRAVYIDRQKLNLDLHPILLANLIVSLFTADIDIDIIMLVLGDELISSVSSRFKFTKQLAHLVDDTAMKMPEYKLAFSYIVEGWKYIKALPITLTVLHNYLSVENINYKDVLKRTYIDESSRDKSEELFKLMNVVLEKWSESEILELYKFWFGVKSPGNFNISNDMIDNMTSDSGLINFNHDEVPNIRYAADDNNNANEERDDESDDDDSNDDNALVAQNSVVQDAINEFLNRNEELKEQETSQPQQNLSGNIANEQVDECKEEPKVIEPNKLKFKDWRAASASTCSYSLRIPQLHSSTFEDKTNELDGILRRSIENQRLLKGYTGYTYQTV